MCEALNIAATSLDRNIQQSRVNRSW